ncbi:hypothetical protein DD238_006822 [Peronospora effusa]|uniref:Uncharacterized protein n=1 Tax=Peronospora effusa TaxID=542832 RepID=A0A3M6V9W3_9STRA|nr:hypothetical protein DD238_006822 [Peronospora effusa]
MTRHERSKVAPRKSWYSMTKVLICSRALHSTLVTTTQQDETDPLVSKMSRARSPNRRAIAIQEVPQATPDVKPFAKLLVFRKTKREMDKERQACEQLQNNKRRVDEVKVHECITMERARPKCARTLEWTCRRTSQYSQTRSRGLRTQSRRRLLF